MGLGLCFHAQENTLRASQPATCLLPSEQSILLVVGGRDALDAWTRVPICRRCQQAGPWETEECKTFIWSSQPGLGCWGCWHAFPGELKEKQNTNGQQMDLKTEAMFWKHSFQPSLLFVSFPSYLSQLDSGSWPPAAFVCLAYLANTFQLWDPASCSIDSLPTCLYPICLPRHPHFYGYFCQPDHRLLRRRKKSYSVCFQNWQSP